MRELSKYLDPVLIIGLLISIGVAVLMILGGYDTLDSLIVGLLSTVVSLLIDIVARLQKNAVLSEKYHITGINSMTNASDRIIDALKGTNIRFFEQRSDVYAYLVERLPEARKHVDVTHTSESIPGEYTKTVNHKYVDVFRNLLMNKSVRVRRVMIMHTPEQLNWAVQLLNEYAKAPLFIGGFPANDSMSYVSIMIIDSEEVLITGGNRNPSYNIRSVSVKHPHVVQVLEEHFESLWQKSIPITSIDSTEELAKKFKINMEASVSTSN